MKIIKLTHLCEDKNVYINIENINAVGTDSCNDTNISMLGSIVYVRETVQEVLRKIKEDYEII